MKTLAASLLALLAALVASVALGGCAIVPYESAPAVYAAPPPAAVVVRPYYYGGYYRGGPYWHRGWR
jgi:hypothetical protein